MARIIRLKSATARQAHQLVTGQQAAGENKKDRIDIKETSSRLLNINIGCIFYKSRQMKHGLNVSYMVEFAVSYILGNKIACTSSGFT